MKRYFVQHDTDRDEWVIRPHYNEHNQPFFRIGLYCGTFTAVNQVDALVKAEIAFTLHKCGGRITKSPDELWHKDLGQI